MSNLTKKEIIAELKKLGINSVHEINTYYKEYKRYSSPNSKKFLSRTAQRIRRQILNKRNLKKRFLKA